ncbi:hypothetical protein GCM10023193_60260 [Planotetraspora kaengkrachanensis]|uniref:Tyr recombinase domain-containing protein n=1 Tax=Planotetraspora kaengkrachanensis TaxID=575193 RepID=A0A8J3V965_9ACTN|nr:site-specific integrase [Planotetraspora kaengkrachanensis]GIG82466.1 hypothetical protein Pka01_55930 [Planotetraspora kaengkrachanensis]
MPGLHLHDLRHTGNMLAAESGAGLKDLMARMGHDNVRAAMIYQHAARGADKAITDAINSSSNGVRTMRGTAWSAGSCRWADQEQWPANGP